MEEKWDHCYGNNFTGVSEKEINCVILNAIFWKKNQLCPSPPCLNGNQKKTAIAK